MLSLFKPNENRVDFYDDSTRLKSKDVAVLLLISINCLFYIVFSVIKNQHALCSANFRSYNTGSKNSADKFIVVLIYDNDMIG